MPVGGKDTGRGACGNTAGRTTSPGTGRIETRLAGLPGILDARVLDLAAPSGELPDCLRVGFVCGPAAIDHARPETAASLELDAIVPVTSIGSDAALSALPVWTGAALARLGEEVRERTGVEEVAALLRPIATRRHVKRAALVPGGGGATDAAPAAPEAAATRTELGKPLSDRPAFVRARPLQVPAGFPATLGDALRAAAQSGRGVIYCGAGEDVREESYAALLDRARTLLGGLNAAGLRPGDTALLDARRAYDFTGGFWACILGGIVPAPIALPPKGADAAAYGRLQAAWQVLGKPPLVTDERPAGADPAIQVLEFARLADSMPGEAVIATPEDTAVVLLTSGSSGVPKGVHQTHRGILSMVAASLEDGIGAGEGDDVFFNWMPLDHVGAVAFHMCGAIGLGRSQVHSDTDTILAEPCRWLDIVARHRVTVTWAPNFAFGLIAAEARERVRAGAADWDLGSLKAVVNGGEAVTEASLFEFLDVLAPCGLWRDVFVPSFGMSETATAITLGALGRARWAFTSLGPPVAGSALRIVDEAGVTLREGEIGRLEVSGPQLFARYHDRPDLDRETRRADPTGAVWFDTGDAGFLADGALYLTGRLKDSINVNGATFFAHEIEAVAAATPGIDSSSVAAVPVRPPGAASEQVALFVALAAAPGDVGDDILHAVLTSLRNRISRQLGMVPDHILPIPAEAFPRTGIGKIVRRTLQADFEAGRFQDIADAVMAVTGGPGYCDLPLHRRVWLEKPGADPTVDASAVRLIPAGDPRTLSVLRDISEPYRPPDDPSADLAGGTLVHASACVTDDTGPNAGPDAGLAAYASLLALAQEIAALPVERRPAEVISLTVRGVAVGRDEAAAPAVSLVPGLIRALNLEIPEIAWRAIDLPSAEPSQVAAALNREAGAGSEPLVAWRGERRFVARLEPAVPGATETANGVPVEAGSLWLVAGGLGGLGGAVAEWLLDRGAWVLLTGRTPAVALSDEKAALMRRLEASGRARYVAFDIADHAALEAAVVAMEGAAARPLAGMLHMAGSGRVVSLDAEDPAELVPMRRTLVGGLRAMAEVAAVRPAARILVTGSVVGQVGGRVVGYAAAHAELAETVHALAAQGLDVARLGFSSFPGIGLSAGQTSEGLLRKDGLVPLDIETGLLAIEAALSLPRREAEAVDWLVGLDATHPVHAGFVELPSAALTRPVAWCRGAGVEDGALPVADALDRPAWGLIRQVADIPRDAEGRPDPVRLALSDAGQRRTPCDETERRIAAIFGEVLASLPPAVNDDFFVLGGSSLLAARLASRLSNLFFVELPVGMVFQNPTVAAITRRLREIESQPGMTDAVARHLAALQASGTATADGPGSQMSARS